MCTSGNKSLNIERAKEKRLGKYSSPDRKYGIEKKEAANTCCPDQIIIICGHFGVTLTADISPSPIRQKNVDSFRSVFTYQFPQDKYMTSNSNQNKYIFK